MITIERPVFFVGMGRSGTTLLVAVVCAHRDLGWFSQHFARMPGFPAVTLLSRLADLDPGFRRSVARHGETSSPLERVRVAPAEAYRIWERCCGEKFLYDFMLGTTATDRERHCVRTTVAKVLRYQGKPRFTSKITGPPRIEYLSSIFPDAIFVHVIRDGRAVVESLLRVPFWRDSYRLREPAWRGGLTDDDLAAWRRDGASPLALAGMQWEAVLRITRREARQFVPERYAEVHYEDFVRDPHRVIDEIFDLCGLSEDPRPHEFLDRRIELRDMNYRWRERLERREIETLDQLLADPLREFDYDADGRRGEDGAAVRRPFVGVRTP